MSIKEIMDYAKSKGMTEAEMIREIKRRIGRIRCPIKHIKQSYSEMTKN